MTSDTYRRYVNALAIVASAAFAGGNLFIGLSMGSYWMRLDPLVFMQGFWPQFTTFLYTIMPLFLLTLAGLVLSARLDWEEPRLKRLWLFAIGLYVATALITLGFHMPENLRLRDAIYTYQEAAAARSYWLLGHIPRVILAFGIPLVALRAVFERKARVAAIDGAA
ncbi:MAG: hypothetical protein K0U69_12355 [Actinomycetia bacterium]|nr:hypothetical protein [Actinomycetes bacterium]MCH9761960.1 hypothetical protein [Actinomycetes bacterium]